MKRILIASVAVVGLATLAQAQGRDVYPHDPLTMGHAAQEIDRTQTASIQAAGLFPTSQDASTAVVPNRRSALPQDGR